MIITIAEKTAAEVVISQSGYRRFYRFHFMIKIWLRKLPEAEI